MLEILTNAIFGDPAHIVGQYIVAAALMLTVAAITYGVAAIYGRRNSRMRAERARQRMGIESHEHEAQARQPASTAHRSSWAPARSSSGSRSSTSSNLHSSGSRRGNDNSSDNGAVGHAMMAGDNDSCNSRGSWFPSASSFCGGDSSSSGGDSGGGGDGGGGGGD
ncbi:hypothetical protein ACOTHJ_12960 [Achromobacter xylosoxidans]|uniref:hypothetical protein n=1 Tax=Achromobacter anxifer TaxID=1287737 RepID=UPI00155CEBE7|nr:hypothetical protein [Achromobacter anxifer]CAB5514603.1 hypothetical protein LMG26857_03662 [Achromobacter anxifer]